MTKLKETLLDILKEDQRLFDEQAELKENLLRELIDQYDPQLIGLLLNHEITRQKFFVSAGKAMIFKGNDFKFFIDENKLDNSYTQFENKIGLKVGSRLLREYRDVVLNFPYKDCVLEGGQSTEEGTDTYFEYNKESGDYDEKKARRKEIFFNQILAKDEIDRLFEPKAFSNVRKYQKDEKGSITESEAKEFTRDENGDIKDNLIIKGNNLLALHSLKEQFRGKVKLIYIDPPYNTGNDSFAYNDNFNHSSWLVFMKNRLEIARELLREDGVIFVQCDDNEEAYLKIILDEVFSRSCFISKINWQRTPEGRTALGQSSSLIKNSTEYIIVFGKSLDNKPNKSFIEKKIDSTEKALNQYNYFFKNEGERILKETIEDSSGNEIKIYEHFNYQVIKIKSEINNIERLKFFDNLARLAAQQKESSLQQRILKSLNPQVLHSVEYIPKSGKFKGENKKAFYLKDNIVLFLKDYAETDGERVYRLSAMNDFWSHDEIQITGISEEGNVSLKRGKKPEKLLSRIIEITTQINDLILDFHLGSGTTAAVAHKMNRQYIGIEQLDYGDNDSVIRLKNVIDGDQSGISKTVNWQGGGSFIYLELAKNNQNALERIEAAGSYEELMTFFDEMYERYFLNYNVKIREFKEKVSQEPVFKNLALERQKQIFGKMLDLNQLYVNRSDMEDTRFHLSENDIASTHNFYGKNPTFL